MSPNRGQLPSQQLLGVCSQVLNACRNHALQTVCNKTGVKKLSDVFEISALSYNLITEKSVKKLQWSRAVLLLGRAEASGPRAVPRPRGASTARYHPSGSSAPRNAWMDAGYWVMWGHTCWLRAGRTPRGGGLDPPAACGNPSLASLHARPGSREGEDGAAEGSVSSFSPCLRPDQSPGLHSQCPDRASHLEP